MDQESKELYWFYNGDGWVHSGTFDPAVTGTTPYGSAIRNGRPRTEIEAYCLQQAERAAKEKGLSAFRAKATDEDGFCFWEITTSLRPKTLVFYQHLEAPA
jgi:hypothetical protein